MSISGGAEGVPDSIRVTDADRERVVTRLQDAVGLGALRLDEVEQRLEAVYRATTHADLAGLTADLPQPEPEPFTPSALAGLRSSNFRAQFVCFALIAPVLAGIGAITERRLPFIVIGVWVLLLAQSYLAATRRVNRRDERRAKGLPEKRRDDRRAKHERAWQGHANAPVPRANGRPHPSLAGPPHRGRSSSRRSGRSPRHRFAVAMFVDVVESTQLNEAMGDDAWSAERERFRRLTFRCLKAQGGWEVNTTGDGVLARFDEPGAAVQAAIAIQQALADRREAQFAPRVRIGIHSGDVIDEGDDIVGSVINLASRVSGVADPDEILITEHVADHLDGKVTTTGNGLHSLKGVAQPRHLLAVTW